MYRIVKETNQLTGRVRYIIERYANYFFFRRWTRDLKIEEQVHGDVWEYNLENAQRKLEIIKSGEITIKEIV